MKADGWPAADSLFRSDPRWLGSDDAYSVPLGEDRTLWLFGDTFIADRSGQTRSESHFIRNSIGIQTGADPTKAEISFHWASGGGHPTSFFEVGGDDWLWPLAGAIVEDVLLLFFMRVRSPSRSAASPIVEWREEGPLGFFDVYDFHFLRVLNPQEHPDLWIVEPVRSREDGAGIISGASLLQEDGHLLAYGWRGRQGFLCRWDASKAAQGDLAGSQWWDGADWETEPTRAAVVLESCTTEFTIHREYDDLIQVQLSGLNGGSMQMRRASRPEGPFSAPEDFYSPPEGSRPGVLVYAAKAHPQLAGADLVCTYASNGRDVDETLRDETIYYPRFVRVWDEEEGI